jgi:hypothetical protein
VKREGEEKNKEPLSRLFVLTWLFDRRHTFIIQTVAVIIIGIAAILRIESPNDLLSIGINPEIV